MKKPDYTRKGQQIINLVTGVVEDFKTVNLAKKRSRQIQMDADRDCLGRGTLRRMPRKTKDRYKQGRMLSWRWS